ncbi:hypothetical protein B0H16DRAFT_1885696 [Mycena metata]|uniref:Uncharacterized protein n=1 Tax=Mycena metata TaxID=1033252 RepID=A0AAD7NE88_9AGAR|nr:hypothetical protein B0H16DRAFT_1885696 [Mycena metata]
MAYQHAAILTAISAAFPKSVFVHKTPMSSDFKASLAVTDDQHLDKIVQSARHFLTCEYYEYMLPRNNPLGAYDAIYQMLFSHSLFKNFLSGFISIGTEHKAVIFQVPLLYVAGLSNSLTPVELTSWFAGAFGPLIEAAEDAIRHEHCESSSDEEPPAKKAKVAGKYARSLELLFEMTSAQTDKTDETTALLASSPVTAQEASGVPTTSTPAQSAVPDIPSRTSSEPASSRSTNVPLVYEAIPSPASLPTSTAAIASRSMSTTLAPSPIRLPTPTPTAPSTSSILKPSVGSRTISVHETPEVGHVRRVRALIAARSNVAPSRSAFSPRLDPSPVKMPGGWPASPKRRLQDITTPSTTYPRRRASGPQ